MDKLSMREASAMAVESSQLSVPGTNAAYARTLITVPSAKRPNHTITPS